jgi:hypothetical protein
MNTFLYGITHDSQILSELLVVNTQRGLEFCWKHETLIFFIKDITYGILNKQ